MEAENKIMKNWNGTENVKMCGHKRCAGVPNLYDYITK